MNLIPDKNLFIITSSIKPNIGAFSDDQRFEQTMETLKSVRLTVPDAIILVSDASVRPLTDEQKMLISQNSNYYIDMGQEPTVKMLSERGMKSQAENLMMFHTLQTLKQAPQVNRLMNSVKRIFKFSGRSVLEDSFDITEYDDLFGKFVFKKRIPTWMPQNHVSHLFITRMFSMCPSLIDTYLGVIGNNLRLVDAGFDTEHAHFANIPQQYLVEFDKLHCWGWLAGNGQIEHY